MIQYASIFSKPFSSSQATVQPVACGPLKSYWWIQKLAPNFSPAVTGSASWSVRLSLLCGASASTEGHSMALPAQGLGLRLNKEAE